MPATVEQVRQLVRVELDKALEERKEREERKCNVVAFGIKEDGKRDKEKIRMLFRAMPMRVGPVFVVRFYRVGKKEGVENERPLLVSLREVVRASLAWPTFKAMSLFAAMCRRRESRKCE